MIYVFISVSLKPFPRYKH